MKIEEQEFVGIESIVQCGASDIRLSVVGLFICWVTGKVYIVQNYFSIYGDLNV